MGNSGSLLIEAAQKNNTAKARELIKAGIDINFRDVKGANALNWAAYNGNLELCMTLVEHGININNQNLAGWTPLHDAAQNGHCEVIEYLLGLKNIDLTKKTSNGWSPLHLAASYGRLDAVKMLIEHDVDIHQISHTGFTPIDVCKSSIRQHVLDFLLARGTPYEQCLTNTTQQPDETPTSETNHELPVPSTSPPVQLPSIHITKTSPQLPKYEEPPNAPPLPTYLKDREGVLEHSDGRINYAQHYRTTVQDLPTPHKTTSAKEGYANVDLSVYNYTTRTDSEKNLLSRSEPLTPPTTSNNNDSPTTNSRYSAHLRSRSFSSSPLSLFSNTTARERSKSASPSAEVRSPELRRVSTSPDVSSVAELRQRISMYERQNEQLMKRVIELQQLTDVQQKVINEQKHKLKEKDKKIAHLTEREEKKERKST